MSELPEPYEVYAVKYADHARTRNDNFIFKDPHDGPMPIDFFVWAIVGNGRTVVVDLGFEEEDARRRGRNLIRLPAEGLRLIDVDPAAVEDVVVTHLHYDHCGTLAHFPRARVHLQDREMAYATGRHMTHAPLRHPFNVDYVVEFVRAVYDDRVNFVDGTAEIAPGISVHRIGGHTDGLQCVRVWTRRGWLVLASDAAHFYANMEIPNPFPVVFNVGDMLEGFATLHALADAPENVVPGHDPLVLRRYPAASKALEGIAVRLDADPAMEAAAD